MPEKFEREIEEILRRASFSTPSRRRASGWEAGLASIWQQITTELTPTTLLMAGIGLALVGYFLGGMLPGAGVPLSLLALICLAGGFAWSISRRRSSQPPRWRGQRIDVRPAYPDLWRNLKRRWQAWRHGHGWTDYRRF